MQENLGNAAPPAPPPPPPPPRPAAPSAKNSSRRKFLTLIAVVGGLLTLTPYVPWGTYLSNSISGGRGSSTKAQTVVLDNNATLNGSAAGKKVNVNDLTSFPPNSHWVMTYPSSGDPNLDGQNPDTFVKFDLIRLPAQLGGSDKSANAFVAFSKVCVHLWCSPNYGGGRQNPPPENQDYECPCHGSLYSVGPTATNKNTPIGLAFSGPAAVQPAPTNAIPMLSLTTDSAGNLAVVPPIWDIDHNGVLAYGRNVDSGFFSSGSYTPK